MTRIKQTEIIHPTLVVAAKCYHQGRGDSRIRAARMYMVSENRDGSGMQEYLLTRYINHLGVAMSSILGVQPSQSAGADSSPEGRAFELVESCREDRKHEEQMIMAWCTQKGGTECEVQNMI